MRVALMMLAVLFGAALFPARAGTPIAVTLRPKLSSNKLTALAITVDFAASRSGETTIDLPDHYAGEQALWKSLRGFAVTGGHAQLLPSKDPAHLIVRSDS